MCRENSRFQDNRQFSKGIIRRFDVHPLVRWHKQRIRRSLQVAWKVNSFYHAAAKKTTKAYTG
mgnify:CR=1 FL=1